MSKPFTFAGAKSTSVNATSDALSAEFMRYVNKVAQFQLSSAGGTATVNIYGSIDGGAHLPDTALATLSLSGANDCKSYVSGATPCPYDTLVAVVSAVSGGAVVSGLAAAYRS